MTSTFKEEVLDFLNFKKDIFKIYSVGKKNSEWNLSDKRLLLTV